MNRTYVVEGRDQTGGFVGSIVVNSILLYVVHHLLEWQIDWILPSWADVLWAVDLSLEVSIVLNVLFIVFHPKWFRTLGGAVSSACAVLSTWWVMTVFPFDFGSSGANDLARWILLLLLIATSIGTFVSLVISVLEFARAVLSLGSTSRRPSA